MLDPRAEPSGQMPLAIERLLGPPSQRPYRLIALVVSLLATVRTAFSVLPTWRNVQGGEAYWVAQSLIQGGGYSFPVGHRWLFEFVDNDQYLTVGSGPFQVTAWTDPLYTFYLAGLLTVFGKYHQLAAAVLNLVLLLAVYGVTYRIAERLISAPAGILAVAALAFGAFGEWNAGVMYNGIVAAFLVICLGLLLVVFLEGPSYRRASLLGFSLGMTTLGWASALLFFPIVATAVAIRGRKNPGRALSQALLVLSVAAITILPWTLRNYIAFGEFIPVRTGFGQISFVGVVGAGGAVAPETLRSHVKTPWSAPTARAAVMRLSAYPWTDEAALQHFQHEYAREVWAADYDTLNEAQRDARFLAETKAYLLTNPVLSAQLAIAKLEVFARSTGRIGGLVCLAAALGGLLSIRSPAVLALTLLVAASLGPYLVAVAYYARYRAPVEPLLAILAAFACWQVSQVVSRRLRIG